MKILFFILIFQTSILYAQSNSISSLRTNIYVDIINRLSNDNTIGIAIIEADTDSLQLNIENSFGYIVLPATINKINDKEKSHLIQEQIKMQTSNYIDSVIFFDTSLCSGCEYSVYLPYLGEDYFYIKIVSPIETYSSFFYLMDWVYTPFKMDTINLTFPVSYYRTDEWGPAKHMLYSYNIHMCKNMYYAVFCETKSLDRGKLKE